MTIGVAGAGHGWVSTFRFGPVMWIALPLMAVRVGQWRFGARYAPLIDWSVLLFGIGLDAALAAATYREMIAVGPEQWRLAVSLGLPLVLIWLALWLSWQVAAVVLIIRSRSDADMRKGEIDGR